MPVFLAYPSIMPFKKIVRIIHLWLGLSSGIIIIVLGITGCILAFEIEIRNLSEPYKFIKKTENLYLPPSVLKGIAEQNLNVKKVISIEYGGKGKAAMASYYDADKYELLYLNPYNGAVQRHKDMTKDFFRFVLEGHYYLWLPHNIGQPICAVATLVFLVMMISGLILWWPKNKAAAKQRFLIKWSAKWRRKNYDLHNVLGFYITWVTIFIAITGLVFGFQWFARSVYFITSAGKTLPAFSAPVSDTVAAKPAINITDQLWAQQLAMVQQNESLTITFASQNISPVGVTINHRPGTYYNTDVYQYDQYNGKMLLAKGSYAGKFAEANMADKIVRMNYDLHTGAVLGLAGKLLAFFASLVAASLPVTGFVIWWGRKKKAKISRH